ncbi:MAG TPA: hypothetical protein VMU19_01850 [Bryobacteraceae bacterium]|nr:hypothetical protein [Bryobacteraceae bacterium]
MKTLKVMIPAAVLAAGFLVCTTSSFGLPAYAKKEAPTVGAGMNACTYCHVTAGKKDLNDTGKCYATNGHKDLGKCTAPKGFEKK